MVQELENLCDGVGVPTCGLGGVNSKNYQYNGEWIEGARDPFVLLRYRVSSAIIGMSERIRTCEERRTFES